MLRDAGEQHEDLERRRRRQQRRNQHGHHAVACETPPSPARCSPALKRFRTSASPPFRPMKYIRRQPPTEPSMAQVA